jgi:hypothetical protein
MLEKNELVISLRVEVEDNTIKFFEHVDKILDAFNDGLNATVKKMAHINDTTAALLNKQKAYKDGMNTTL